MRQQFLDEQCIFSQLDPRWSRKTLGNTPYTIKEWGCTITALCRAIFKLTGNSYHPAQLAKLLDFDLEGKVYWASLKKVGIKAVRKKMKLSAGNLRSIAKSKNEVAILDINNGAHWVAFESVWLQPFISVSDPLKGVIVKKNVKVMSGYAVLSVA